MPAAKRLRGTGAARAGASTNHTILSDAADAGISGSSAALAAELNKLREKGLFCDVVVSGCNEARLRAHQVVLAAASASLREFFTGPTAEGSSDVAATLAGAPEPVELRLRGVTNEAALSATLARMYGCSTAVGTGDEAADLLAKGFKLAPGGPAGAGTAGDLMEALSTLRAKGLLCDVAIKAGGWHVEAHQAVLAAASPGMRQYLSESLQKLGTEVRPDGAASCQPLELELEGVTHHDALLTMINHIYGADGKTDYKPTSEGTNRDVLRLAIGFELPRLKERATQWMMADVSKNNMDERLAACKEFGLTQLEESIREAVGDKAVPTEEKEEQEDEEEDDEEKEEHADEAAATPQRASTDMSEAGTPIAQPPSQDAALLMQLVRFGNEEVPVEAPDGLSGPETKQDFKVLSRLYELFEERPVWLPTPLQEQLPASVNEATLLKLLPFVAYQWFDGPWQHAYARLGWDPRLDHEESMTLQVFPFRDPHFMRRGGGKAGVQDCHFRRPPVLALQYYQLEDIKDQFVNDIVQSSDPLKTCDKKTGFIPQVTLDAVRDRLTFRTHELRERLAAKEKNEKEKAVAKGSFKKGLKRPREKQRAAGA